MDSWKPACTTFTNIARLPNPSFFFSFFSGSETFSKVGFLLAMACALLLVLGITNAQCPDPPLTGPKCPVDCGKSVSIEKVGSLGFHSNWASPVPIRDQLYFIDKSGGEIYVLGSRNSDDGELTKVFDKDHLPVDINWDYDSFNPGSTRACAKW